ncbi:hypothetical protein GCM10009798_06260 [Nocardioides panacihumi]|uniref:Uncharacterized protein n=1 Tax=Nocardioides panacihumi TaxID=400774 RepID=A0ABP5BNW9_9ACTN
MDHVLMVCWFGFAVFARWRFVKQKAEYDRRLVRIVGEVVTLTLVAVGALMMISLATGHA